MNVVLHLLTQSESQEGGWWEFTVLGKLQSHMRLGLGRGLGLKKDRVLVQILMQILSV